MEAKNQKKKNRKQGSFIFMVGPLRNVFVNNLCDAEEKCVAFIFQQEWCIVKVGRRLISYLKCVHICNLPVLCGRLL